MAATLKDIAREASVSISTVSRVLREERHPMISESTCDKVQEAARRLGYRRNLHARSLRLGKSQVIGVLTLALQSHVSLEQMHALDREIWSRGYRSLLRSAGGHPEMELAFIEECLSSNVDGFLLMHASPGFAPAALDPLLENGVPVVTMQPIEGARVDCVSVDRRHGAREAIRHLLGTGRRRIGFIHASRAGRTVIQRLQGYEDALAEHGLSVEPDLLEEAKGTGCEGGYGAARRLLARRPLPNALFCNNDEVAIGAMKAVQDAGLGVPDDVAVVGFDDIPIAGFLSVPLTTVAQPIAESARLAVEMLFQRMEDPGGGTPPRNIGLEPRLVVRRSCGCGGG